MEKEDEKYSFDRNAWLWKEYDRCGTCQGSWI
jgi:hypothetical protein